MAENRTELGTGAERLRDARENADDDAAAERLDDFAERVERMADADRGHLARLEHGLRDVQSDLGEDAAAAVDDALERVRAYRETVEGA